MNTLEIEILAEGKWNGTNITRSIMEKMVENFGNFKDILQVPLKLGHNDEQPMTDGMPALGWIESIRINEAGKMVAKAVDLPDIVYQAIKKKLYRNVSIEASLEVEHKGKEYGAVLTGLALLGADLPAVNTLNDLQAYMSRTTGINFSQNVNFSAMSGNKKEDTSMDTIEELQAKLAAANAKVTKLSAEKETVETLAAQAKAKLEAENAALKASQEAVEFSANKQALDADMEALVKAEKITPAQRDKFAAQAKDKVSLSSVKMTVDILKEGLPNKGLNKGENGLNDEQDKDLDLKGQDPSTVIHAKATRFSIENNCSYAKAVDSVMLSEPKLARAYADMTGSN